MRRNKIITKGQKETKETKVESKMKFKRFIRMYVKNNERSTVN